MSSRLYFTACLACVIAFAPQAFAQSAPLYTVTKTVALGAPDRWDFVVFDPASHKVFVAHGDRVTVVDGRTGAILGNSRDCKAAPMVSQSCLGPGAATQTMGAPERLHHLISTS